MEVEYNNVKQEKEIVSIIQIIAKLTREERRSHQNALEKVVVTLHNFIFWDGLLKLEKECMSHYTQSIREAHSK